MRRLAALIGAVSVLVGCSGGGGSVDELCGAWRAVPDAATLFSGFDPSDATRALEQLRAGEAVLRELRSAAPSEPRADLDVELAYFSALIDALSALDSPDAERSAEVVRQVTADHPGVADAAARLSAFTLEECSTPAGS